MALAFGTSGIRGLVTEFNENECYRYVAAFIQYLKLKNIPHPEIILAVDLRESSPAIQNMIANALASFQVSIRDAGAIPTPALAWACHDLKLPGIMITGSHIPADRNGFKFYLSEGEILKEDEKIIFENYSKIASSLDKNISVIPKITPFNATEPYIKRYLSVFPKNILDGLKIGIYQHSSVGRDIVVDVLKSLGAEVTAFGRETHFVPVDTEAVTAIGHLKKVLIENKLDAIVSTDGDADRPLVMADDGRIVPGEILGLITSKELDIQTVVCPISCSTLIEKSGWIPETVLTQIGSPFVLGKIKELREKFPNRKIAGFEANGGYILSTAANGFESLNTRDSLLPILTVLIAAKKSGQGKISFLLDKLPPRVNQSGLIKNFSREKSEQTLRRVDEMLKGTKTFSGLEDLGKVTTVNRLDGTRMLFENGVIVHLRPSGNAPEFRIYIEADSEDSAQQTMDKITHWISP